MIRMILTDLDHTLLREDGSISEKTLQSLAACRAKGIRFAIGLVWYFHKKKQENAGPDQTEESSDPVQEEEINETTHYGYQ